MEIGFSALQRACMHASIPQIKFPHPPPLFLSVISPSSLRHLPVIFPSFEQKAQPGFSAAVDGRLRPGDTLLAVNGRPVVRNVMPCERFALKERERERERSREREKSRERESVCVCVCGCKLQATAWRLN